MAGKFVLLGFAVGAVVALGGLLVATEKIERDTSSQEQSNENEEVMRSV